MKSICWFYRKTVKNVHASIFDVDIHAMCLPCFSILETLITAIHLSSMFAAKLKNAFVGCITTRL